MAPSLHNLCNLPIFSLHSDINFQVDCSQSLNSAMLGLYLLLNSTLSMTIQSSSEDSW